MPGAEPSLDFERAAWAAGALRVAGLDEVGRGSLAGPVVAAAVVLPTDEDLLGPLEGVRDSKQLAPRARCRLHDRVLDVALGVGVGAVSALLVDVLGIARATQLAMVRALVDLPCRPDYLLLDAFALPLSPLPQRAIVRGDRQVLSIAAASVVAKVRRDADLVALGARRPGFGFDRHKGYASERHRRALAARGPTPEHRLTWAPLRSSAPRRAFGQMALPWSPALDG